MKNICVVVFLFLAFGCKTPKRPVLEGESTGPNRVLVYETFETEAAKGTKFLGLNFPKKDPQDIVRVEICPDKASDSECQTDFFTFQNHTIDWLAPGQYTVTLFFCRWTNIDGLACRDSLPPFPYQQGEVPAELSTFVANERTNSLLVRSSASEFFLYAVEWREKLRQCGIQPDSFVSAAIVRDPTPFHFANRIDVETNPQFIISALQTEQTDKFELVNKESVKVTLLVWKQKELPQFFDRLYQRIINDRHVAIVVGAFNLESALETRSLPEGADYYSVPFRNSWSEDVDVFQKTDLEVIELPEITKEKAAQFKAAYQKTGGYWDEELDTQLRKVEETTFSKFKQDLPAGTAQKDAYSWLEGREGKKWQETLRKKPDSDSYQKVLEYQRAYRTRKQKEKSYNKANWNCAQRGMCVLQDIYNTDEFRPYQHRTIQASDTPALVRSQALAHKQEAVRGEMKARRTSGDARGVALLGIVLTGAAVAGAAASMRLEGSCSGLLEEYQVRSQAFFEAILQAQSERFDNMYQKR
ncbi:MAG: hypothetical protein HYW48_08120 [Deltaproteobacteria bacterium]|nr:hypothetical protein [Deltaproteobacteria bacterium]